MILLKRTLKKWSGRVVDCINWLRIRSGDESCEQRYSLSGFAKCGKFVHSLRMWLLISLGLLSIQLVVTVPAAAAVVLVIAAVVAAPSSRFL
jgi:hypothetical protein